MTTLGRNMPMSLRLIKNIGVPKCNYATYATTRVITKATTFSQRPFASTQFSYFSKSSLNHNNSFLTRSPNTHAVKYFSSGSNNSVTAVVADVGTEVKWFMKGAKQLLADTINAVKLKSQSSRTASEHLFVSRTVATWKSCGPLIVLYILPVLGNIVFLLLWLKPLAIPSWLLSPVRRHRCTVLRYEQFKADYEVLLSEPEGRYSLLPRQVLFRALIYLNDNSLLNAARSSNQLYNKLNDWKESIRLEDAQFLAEGFPDTMSTSELIKACDNRGLLAILTSDLMSEYAKLHADTNLVSTEAEKFTNLDLKVRSILIASLQDWVASTSKMTDTSLKSYLLLTNSSNQRSCKLLQ